eukprot:TRINITY_DN20459_c0_g1_i1.p1 TRINITY_DN20459_c0_g1~~TRINITY_DN20459_c0_g1_i1.p1  ORF type:complete len:218 (-),score=49.45 TRINITY_DN20459_c0_g1_i1:40-693(-)
MTIITVFSSLSFLAALLCVPSGALALVSNTTSGTTTGTSSTSSSSSSSGVPTTGAPAFATTAFNSSTSTSGGSGDSCNEHTSCSDCTGSISCVWCNDGNQSSCRSGRWYGPGDTSGCSDYRWEQCEVPGHTVLLAAIFSFLGLVLLIVLCVVICCCCCRRKKRASMEASKRRQKELRQQRDEERQPLTTPTPRTDAARKELFAKYNIRQETPTVNFA